MRALKTLSAAAFLFCVAWLGLRRFETSQLYAPSHEVSAHPGSYGLAYQTLSLRTEDGETLQGWFVPLGPQSPVLLFCHGNAGTISSRLDKLLHLRAAGASVLLFDYRGYGRSSGRPSERGTYRDGEAAYRWLTETRGVPPGRIVFHGESLGCGVAVELASRLPCAGLIVESGFTSIVDMGKVLFPRLPIRLMVSMRYDNVAKIGLVRAPVLVLHGPQDEVIPYAMGRRLFSAAREPKAFVELRGGHDEGFRESGEVYVEGVKKFLREVMSPSE